MVGVSASNLPLHHEVQKFSSGTVSPGWSWKKGRKTVVVVVVVLLLLLLLLHPSNGLFSRTTWVSWHQKRKPLRILLEQEMIRWQWHQLDYMQIICTSLQTDNHTVYLTTQFLEAGCPSCSPTNSVKALKALVMAALWNRAGHYIFALWFLSLFFF